MAFGLITGAITLEILAPKSPTAEVRYTLNNTIPGESSTLYTGPITLTTTTQIRAVTVGANGKLSTLSSQTYVALNNNLLDNSYRAFVGAPEIGRMAYAQLGLSF